MRAFCLTERTAPCQINATDRKSDMAKLVISDQEHARLSSQLRGVVQPIVRDRETTNDLVQDAWTKLAENWGSLGDTPNVGGWLSTVARNLAINYVKSGEVRFRARVELGDVEPHSREPGPDEETGLISDGLRISEALSALPDRHRDVIVLCDVDGCSYVQAGESLGVSEAAVTSLLSRARAGFRRQYRLRLAPLWLRGIAEDENVDDLLMHIDPFDPPDDLAADLIGRTERRFDDIALKWDELRQGVVPPKFEENLLARAGLKPGMSALDAGTGTGSIALHLAPIVRRVIGLDRSEPMLKIARKRAESSSRRNVVMEFGDVLDLPVKGGLIDAAFCSLVLRHLLEPGRAVAEMARTLKTGGRLIVADIVKTAHSGGDESVRAGLSPKQVGGWMREAGLTGVDVEEIKIGPKGSSVLVGAGRRPK